jgi:hypothetical protein
LTNDPKFGGLNPTSVVTGLIWRKEPDNVGTNFTLQITIKLLLSSEKQNNLQD